MLRIRRCRRAASRPHGLIPVKTDPLNGARAVIDSDGNPVYNYDLAIPVMLLRFFPTGILGWV